MFSTKIDKQLRKHYMIEHWNRNFIMQYVCICQL